MDCPEMQTNQPDNPALRRRAKCLLWVASCHCESLMPLRHSMVEALPLKSSREES
jgi:hypothetical protein